MNLNNIYPNRDVAIEIGFGMGHATWQIAKDNPNIGYIGIEVHTPGVGRLLHQMNAHDVTNLRVIEHDAVEVIDHMIPKDSISGVHIFFPDPWQKKKHHKRRLIQVEFIKKILNVVKPGGYIYVVSDWVEYAEHILDVFNKVDGLSNPYNGYATAQDWRPKTKFESKGLDKNHVINEILFRKE
ncbi:MAG: tRNA (guanosine(46)-N7)-methyltransferase TrmB [Spirochaetaceae bacterium 4572_7]|nr:MAG: tRNA (guanosine(46)-N7)-methyltransferase TrmB [Spirochaetaceae bacterium 4572_7]